MLKCFGLDATYAGMPIKGRGGIDAKTRVRSIEAASYGHHLALDRGVLFCLKGLTGGRGRVVIEESDASGGAGIPREAGVVLACADAPRVVDRGGR